MTEIKDAAFKGCTSLEKAILPSTLKMIHYEAFIDTAIKYIYIPTSVSSIWRFAFKNTTIIGEEGSSAETFVKNYASESNLSFLKGIPTIIKDISPRISTKKDAMIPLEISIYTLSNIPSSFSLYRSTNKELTDAVTVQTSTIGKFEISENANGEFYYYIKATSEGTSKNSTVCRVTVTDDGITKHTITANSGVNGSISPTQTKEVIEGESATYTFTPMTGYTIDTLKIDGVSVYAGVLSYTFENVVEDHTIEVTYRIKPATVTITYNGNGGTVTNPTAVIAFDSILSNSVIPIRTGYKFLGWYADIEGTNPVDFSLKQRSNTTFYAKWELKYITIDLYKNKSQFSLEGFPLTPQLFGTMIADPGVVTWTGYIFKGWSRTRNGPIVTFPYQIIEDTSVSFYAIWESDGTRYSLTLMPNGGEGGGVYSSGLPDTTMKEPTANNPNYVFRSNYRIEGWYTDAACTKPFSFTSAKYTANTILYPKWVATATQDDCKITFDANGGAGMDNCPYRYAAKGSTFVLATSPQYLTREKYTLEGWSATVGGALIDSTYVINGDVTLYAKWVSVKKKVNFYYASSTVPFSTISHSIDMPVTLPSNLTAPPTGKEFVGWYTDPLEGRKIADANEYITEDTNYYAHFNTEKIKITYNMNYLGDLSPEATISEVEYLYGDTVSLEAPTITTGKFAGWFTEATGGSHIRTAPLATKSFTYYAHWVAEDAALSTITFDMNGAAEENVQYSDYYNTKIDPPANPIKQNYYFTGWYTQQTGGMPVYFKPFLGDYEGLSKECFVTGDVTFYAHWSVTNPATTILPIVKFNGNNGKTQDVFQIKVPSGELSAAPECPFTKEGYVFLGWYTSISGGTLISSEGKITSYKNYYAHWRRILPGEFTVTFSTGDMGYFLIDDVKTSQVEVKADMEETILPPKQIPVCNTLTQLFSNWSLGTTAVISTIRVTSDATYVANYQNGLTVTFNTNGGTAIDDQKVVSGGIVIKPTDPVKEGYQFDGWYTTPYYSITNDFNLPIYKNSTYYAKWLSTEATLSPTIEPTVVPTAVPTVVPTVNPKVTPAPTSDVTAAPTIKPTAVPTTVPTIKPTVVPTTVPTVPTATATTVPATTVPTATPRPVATPRPTATPRPVATPRPTATPRPVVTAKPTVIATAAPTSVPVVIAPGKVAKGSIVSLKSKKTKTFTVSMKKIANASGYEMLLATNKKFKTGKKTVTTNTLTCKVSKLKKGKTYYVKVRAYSLDSTNKKKFGSYSVVRKIKIK